MTSAVLAALLAVPAAAGVTVSSASIEVSISAPKGRPVFHTVETLLLPPDAKPAARLRAVLSVDNDGPRAESGAIVRFALSARIRRVAENGSGGEGQWTVPFLLEERHLPQVKRGRGVPVNLPLNRVAIVQHLKSLRSAGYWPDALRLEAVFAPRAGESLEGRTAVKTIAVDWKPASGKPAPPLAP
ncbi:MAG: hypothetical protein FD126_919 [Elusimicrobia bacterium]|nr:MAG: hypothetical protein FD126_919 [Elusimicrobiota bacterium]